MKAKELKEQFRVETGHTHFSNFTIMDEYAEWLESKLIDSQAPTEGVKCQYESDDTTAMNCKHCGDPKWVHDQLSTPSDKPQVTESEIEKAYSAWVFDTNIPPIKLTKLMAFIAGYEANPQTRKMPTVEEIENNDYYIDLFQSNAHQNIFGHLLMDERGYFDAILALLEGGERNV